MVGNIGIIGIGPIGIHFVGKLKDGGHNTIVYDIDKEQMKKASEIGATLADSVHELAGQADVIILALPGDFAVEAVMEGEDGLLAVLKPKHIVIDTGTSSPRLDCYYERQCVKKGAGFLEAPVTWRAPGLIIMPAGERKLFDAVEPLIKSISYKYRYVGESGRGQELKAVNQLLFSARCAIAAETVAYAEMLGFGKEELEDFLEFGLAPSLYGDDFTKINGTVRLNFKDLKYAQEIAFDHKICLPVTAAVYQAFLHTVIHGGGECDQNGIIRYWRDINKMEVDVL